MDSGQIILFQTQGGETKIEVRLANESVWLTADQMAELFQRDRSTIQRHVKRIYQEGELKPSVLTMTLALKLLSTSSRQYRTRCILPLTGTLPLKWFTKGRMLKTILWI